MTAMAWKPETPAPAPESAGLRRQLATLRPIGLDELGEGNLQDRIDTKFLFPAGELSSLLDALAADYRVLEINGARLHGYQTLYFDTPRFDLYNAQHAGRPDRYKVRSRRYIETRQAFLEVKHKNRRNRTVKNRVATGTLLTDLDADAAAFVRAHLPFSGELEPKLWNRFSRITLVHVHEPERLTFDLDVAFGKELITTAFPGVVVAELKQAVLNRGSEFLRQARLRGIRATGFSKYCIGAALLHDDLKHNRFKPELLRAQQLSERYLNR
ncbi:MAG: polyphosphate polymerase domain-containing protein [Dehalococcoidia bacterium]